MLKTNTASQANGNERFFTAVPAPYNAFNIDLGGTGVNDVDVALIKMSVIFYQTGPRRKHR